MPQFRSSDDVALAYTDEGHGTPVVLVAGFLAAATSRHTSSAGRWGLARSGRTSTSSGMPAASAWSRSTRHGHAMWEEPSTVVT